MKSPKESARIERLGTFICYFDGGRVELTGREGPEHYRYRCSTGHVFDDDRLMIRRDGLAQRY